MKIDYVLISSTVLISLNIARVVLVFLTQPLTYKHIFLVICNILMIAAFVMQLIISYHQNREET